MEGNIQSNQCIGNRTWRKRISGKDHEEFKRINQFYLNVGDMLAEIADVLAPQNLEQLLEYGLQGLEV